MPGFLVSWCTVLGQNPEHRMFCANSNSKINTFWKWWDLKLSSYWFPYLTTLTTRIRFRIVIPFTQKGCVVRLQQAYVESDFMWSLISYGTQMDNKFQYGIVIRSSSQLNQLLIRRTVSSIKLRCIYTWQLVGCRLGILYLFVEWTQSGKTEAARIISFYVWISQYFMFK